MTHLTKEIIPNGDDLYYRVHKSFFVDGELTDGVFRMQGEGSEEGMSTDWSKYSSPEDSLNRSKPEDNGIVKLNVGEVRKIELAVEHNPIVGNIAHTHVLGIPKNKSLKTKVRFMLGEIYSWEIKYPRAEK